jgi:hypothetical protein
LSFHFSQKLRKEHTLRVLENRMLRGIFRLKRDEVTGEWRRLHKEELVCTDHKILFG